MYEMTQEQEIIYEWMSQLERRIMTKWGRHILAWVRPNQNEGWNNVVLNIHLEDNYQITLYNINGGNVCMNRLYVAGVGAINEPSVVCSLYDENSQDIAFEVIDNIIDEQSAYF